MTGLSASFRRPFAYQVAAFRIRLADLRASTKWTDVWQAEHDRAFMVAGATKAALLSDLAAAIDKAISKGTTLEEFRKDFAKAVKEHNWHGWAGETTEKGKAWRTRVIYRTNLATSYAAGRRAQLIEAGFPLWVYRHGNALDPRVQHLGWDGLILPADHPWWVTHSPPNGWGCTCYVVGARSMDGARRRGGKPDVVLPDGWQKSLPNTGAPEGIDKGWAYAPGSTISDTINALRPSLETLPDAPSVAVIQDWLTEQIFGAWLKSPTSNFPLVRISADDASKIGSEKLVVDISAETARKQLERHPELSILDYAQAQRVVSFATKVIKDSERSIIYILETPGTNGHVLVVKATVSGKAAFVTSFRRISGDAQDRARYIRQLEKRSVE